jgi:hypothetical protein
MITFNFLNKLDFDKLSKDIFFILADNMSKIAPTGNSFEDDYNSWFFAVKKGLVKEQRRIILILSDDELIGFFQYYTNNNTLMMEEIQIRSDWQGKVIFRNLYGFLLSNLNTEINNVEAYANKKNLKSQIILNHLGLTIDGENKNGKSYHYYGKFDDLLDWYYNMGSKD